MWVSDSKHLNSRVNKQANEEINISALLLSSGQIRSSITTLLFSGREFSWTRHMLIAAAILAFNNMLVIFVPTIRDIFGFIGEWPAKRESEALTSYRRVRLLVGLTQVCILFKTYFFVVSLLCSNFRLVRGHHAHLHPPRCLLPSPGQITAHALSAEDWGKFFSPVPKYLWFSLLDFFFFLMLVFFFLCIFSYQAAVFLVVGVIFMIGSLTLIVYDWIHNPPGSGGGH